MVTQFPLDQTSTDGTGMLISGGSDESKLGTLGHDQRDGCYGRNSASQTAGIGEQNRGDCKHQPGINQVQNGEISMEKVAAGTAAVEHPEGLCPWLVADKFRRTCTRWR